MCLLRAHVHVRACVRLFCVWPCLCVGMCEFIVCVFIVCGCACVCLLCAFIVHVCVRVRGRAYYVSRFRICVHTDRLIFDGGAGHTQIELPVLLDAGLDQGLDGALVLEQQEGITYAHKHTHTHRHTNTHTTLY